MSRGFEGWREPEAYRIPTCSWQRFLHADGINFHGFVQDAKVQDQRSFLGLACVPFRIQFCFRAGKEAPVRFL